MSGGRNALFIFSDEHNKSMLSCEGHPLVKTPHLDKLAAKGTRFTNAYCNSPICVPSRAILATGKHNAEIGYWDNADPYDGRVKSWHHRVVEAGHDCVSIGKLHFKDQDSPVGFSDQIIPLNVVGGIGDLLGLIRSPLPERKGAANLSKEIGPGDSTYIQYDLEIADKAASWLQARKKSDGTFVLFVSFVCPHFPLIAPPEFFEMYPADKIPLPKFRDEKNITHHPYYEEMRKCMNYDEYFDEEKMRIAIASYYGLCSFLDSNIGKVLSALSESEIADTTDIIYSSDHGDALGQRKMWGKSTMFEESAGIPMIVSGKNIPENKTVKTAVSLVDIYPTILDITGIKPQPHETDMKGDSLCRLANQSDDMSRSVLCEYHAAGSPVGAFLIRKENFKYTYFAEGYPAQLFDIDADPDELNDLSSDENYADVMSEMHKELLKYCDPESVNKLAKQQQEEKINRHGGAKAIIERGDFGYSPTPTQKAVFS